MMVLGWIRGGHEAHDSVPHEAAEQARPDERFTFSDNRGSKNVSIIILCTNECYPGVIYGSHAHYGISFDY